MNKIERIDRKSKIKGGVYIVFMPSKNYKKVCAWTNEMKFIFIGAGLDRRQRGGLIRRGLKFFKQKENQTNEN